MIRKLIQKTKSIASKILMAATGLMITADLALADGDPLAAGLPTIKSAFAVGSTFYYTIFTLGLAGALIRGKQTGDWVKWIATWAVCLVGYTVGGLIIGGTA